MVFCNTRRNTGFVVRNLSLNGIPAVSVHGGYTQAKRNMIMEDFHAKKIKVLVCTDVAARGLDIEGISHVYNYELPKDAKDYVHRIGRTARAGKDGKAINLLSSRDYENFNKIEDDPSLHIVKMELPQIEKIIPRSFRENRSRGSDGRAYRFGHRQDHRSSGRDYHRSGDRRSGERGHNEGRYHKREDYHKRDDRKYHGRSHGQGNRSFHRKPNYNLGEQ